MKNISLSLAALVLMLASVKTSNAQSTALYASNVVVMHNNNGGITSEGGIDARALQNFKKEYSTVDNAKWEQMPDGFLSKFVQKNVQFRIGYNAKGDWQFTERTYTESNMPIDVKKTIEHEYVGYTISLVEEIATRQRTVYLVHIENEEWSMKIKVEGNETEPVTVLKKAD